MISHKHVVFGLLLSLVIAVLVRGGVVSAGMAAAPTNDPYSLPRETGLVGSGYLQEMQKYNSIGSGGDLSVTVPLYTLPGKIPVSIDLTHQSGIRLDQSATWVGLGWQLGGWSVRRIAVHGDDVHSFEYRGHESRMYINDVYQVDIPGASLKFMNVGTMAEPEFVPMSHSLYTLEAHGVVSDTLCAVDLKTMSYFERLAYLAQHPDLVNHMNADSIIALWYYWNYTCFTLTDQNGRQYVFKLPLKSTSIAECRSLVASTGISGDLGCYQNKSGRVSNSEWLLTAILDHDYVDGGGDPHQPLDSDHPLVDNLGNWVALLYAADTADYRHAGTRWLTMGEWQSGEPLGNERRDSTQVSYLDKIVCPSVVVDFQRRYVVQDFETIRFWRSYDYLEGYEDTHRLRDMVLTRMRVYEYNGTPMTEPLYGQEVTWWGGRTVYAEELHGVVFSYEWPDVTPLKTSWHQHFMRNGDAVFQGANNCSRRDGEPTLRAVSIGTGIAYMLDPNWTISSNEVACEEHANGCKRRYTFEYHTVLDTSTHFLSCLADSIPQQHGSRDFASHSIWTYGLMLDPRGYQLVPDTWPWSGSSLENQVWVEDTAALIPDIWSQRDFFGYHYKYPWAWSLQSMTTPEGATYRYEYESDEYMVGDQHWVSGGCRVKSIVLNAGTPAEYPYTDSNQRDSIWFTYGTEDKPGIGYATAMPNNWVIFRNQYTQQSVAPCPGDRLSMRDQLRFQGDNVNHTIQYPAITWHMFRDRGTVEHYYLTADSVGGHDLVTMLLLCNAADTLTYGKVFNFDYGFWLDRSPLLGVPYKTVTKDVTDREISFAQSFFSWPIMAANLCPDPDGFTSVPGYPTRFDNDTTAISYHLRLDSTISRSYGVETRQRFKYEDNALARLSSTEEIANGVGQYTFLEYAASGNPATPNDFDSRHYLSLLASKTVTSDPLGSTVKEAVVYTYRDDFPSQPGPEQGIYFLETEGHHVYIPSGAGSHDTLTTTVLDVDKWGNASLIEQPDGTRVGYVHSIRGEIAEFAGVNGGDYGICDAEDILTNQPAVWDVAARITDSGAFTGRRALLFPGGGYATIGVLEDVSPGVYVAECWISDASVGDLYLWAMGDGVALSRGVPVGDRGYLCVCSLQVTSHTDLEINCSAGADTKWYDDIRVYRAGAQVNSQTLDPMGRQISVSGPNNVPIRTYYDQYGQVLTKADAEDRPVAGQEFFFKTTESGAADPSYDTRPEATPLQYRADWPNVVYDIKARSGGIVEDFSSIRPNEPDAWASHNTYLRHGELRFEYFGDSVKTGYATLGTEVFNDGILFFDLQDSLGWNIQCYGGGEGTPQQAALWYGFHNAAGNGYACCFTQDGWLHIFRYQGGNQYANVTVIHSVDFRLLTMRDYCNYWTCPSAVIQNYWNSYDHDKQRLGIGRFGSYLYFFIDGDCIYSVSDAEPGWSDFCQVSLRFQRPQGLSFCKTSERLSIDNLVFYGDPEITTHFVDAHGAIKQSQTFDGERIIVSGGTHSIDMKQQAVFKPIYVKPSAAYGRIGELNDSINPFDFIDGYLNSEAIHGWQPGDSLDVGSLLCNWYRDTTGTANVEYNGRLCPYTEFRQTPDPLTKSRQVFHPGEFRPRPIMFDYGATNEPLDGFSPVCFAADSVLSQITVDEDGNAVIAHMDKRGNVIALERRFVGRVALLDDDLGDSIYAEAKWGGPYTVQKTCYIAAFSGDDSIPGYCYMQTWCRTTNDDTWARVYLNGDLVDSLCCGEFDVAGLHWTRGHNLALQPGDIVTVIAHYSPDVTDHKESWVFFRYESTYTEPCEPSCEPLQGDSVASSYTQIHRDFYGYDSLTVQPEGQHILRRYSNRGLVCVDSSGDYGEIYYSYDQMGRCRFTLDAGDAMGPCFKYNKYDQFGRLIEQGIYNNLGMWSVGINDPDFPHADNSDTVFTDVTARYEYDGGVLQRGRLTKTIRYASRYPDSASWTEYKYDLRGRLIETLQHVNLVDSADSYRRIRIAYNNLDQPVRITYNNGKYIDYIYDRAGRVKRIEDDDGILSAEFEYWPTGQIKRKTLGSLPAQVVDYYYNARDWLVSVNEGAIGPGIYGNSDHFALTLDYTSGAFRGDSLSEVGWEYPGGYYSGNIAGYRALTNHNAGLRRADSTIQRFAYDALGRLVAEKYDFPTNLAPHRYAFDDNGRIQSITDTLGHYLNYAYASGSNRLMTVTSDTGAVVRLSYMPYGGVHQYLHLDELLSYNAHQELAKRAMPGEYGTDYAQFWYNTSGQRIAKGHTFTDRVQCDTTYLNPGKDPFGFKGMAGPIQMGFCDTVISTYTGYYYMGDNQLFEYAGPREYQLIGNYVYVNGERLARFKDSDAEGVQYYLSDHLGSVGGTVRPDGQMTSYHLYRPYGEKLSSQVWAGSDNKYGYTGQQLDEDLPHELYYYGARYYDPALKVFTQVDPQAQRYPDLGPYTYCAGNPVKYVDPTGGVVFPFLMAWAAAVAADPGTQMDVMEVCLDLSNGDWVGAAAGTVGIAAPGVSAKAVKGAVKAADEALDAVTGYLRSIDDVSAAAGRATDEAVDAAKKVPNPNGRKGDLSHQAGVDAAEKEARADSPGSLVKREGRIDTPGGAKSTRYGDVVVYQNNVPTKVYQVGRTLKDGVTYVARERQAAADIGMQHIPVEMRPVQ